MDTLLAVLVLCSPCPTPDPGDAVHAEFKRLAIAIDLGSENEQWYRHEGFPRDWQVIRDRYGVTKQAVGFRVQRILRKLRKWMRKRPVA